jgi:ring-1,2-phenylacetyl-CoA epoxidase subunit PaaC
MSSPAFIDYILHLADNALILGHRNSEWTGHGPILEQDIALSNIALDLIGQARNLYQYAAGRINASEERDSGVQVDGRNGAKATGFTEDSLAYLRDAWDFKSCLLVEQPNGDWGKTVLRQFFFSAYQYYFYDELRRCRNVELAAIAEKSLKEVTYHLRWSGEWVIRLGDGTDESHSRMERAMEQLWQYTGELFEPAGYEQALVKEKIAVDLAVIRPMWDLRVKEVLNTAQLTMPGREWMQTGGKEGKHTEYLGYLLAEMQFLQRSYPGCEW